MAVKDQIIALARDAESQFLAGVRGEIPDAQTLEDIRWAWETIMAGGFLSMAGNPADRQAAIDQELVEAHAVLTDYATARQIDGRTLTDTTFRNVLTKATDILFSVALRAATGGVA